MVEETESRYLTSMAAISPIDISSSDSDLDIGESDTSETRQSGNVRILPPWATKAAVNARTGQTGVCKLKTSSGFH